VLECGHISGPRDLYSSKYTPVYRQRLTAALEILLDSCLHGQSVGSDIFTTDTTSASVVLPAGSVVKRQTIVQVATVVNRELPVLQRLLQMVHLLFVQGRHSLYTRINHRWKDDNDGALERSRLCLLKTVGIDLDSADARCFLTANGAAGFSRPPFSAIEFQKYLDEGMRGFCQTYRLDDDSPSLMSAFSVLFGDAHENPDVNDMIDPRSVLVRSLFEVMMRRAHPQMRWGASGVALRSYLCMLGTPRRAGPHLITLS